MTLSKLRNYIELIEVRNDDNALGESAVVGLSTQKEMISTKANLAGVNLSSYKVFPPDAFAFVPDTSRRGDKMSLAYNHGQNKKLVSSISVVFRVSKPGILLSDYLFMFFNRPEFDRYARFNSWGSAREAFSWEEMCDIDIALPPFEVQQKYVNTYKAMIANQQCYERGLDDLKLTIDAQIDEIKNTADRIHTGALLEEVDNRNTDDEINNVQGININKQFMPSVANTNGVDLRKYKIVRNGQFAYSGMQTGRDECIRIALYNGDDPIIISPAYTVMQIKGKKILPEYIMMWFSRKESDRKGWFMSDGSIRSNLDLDRFYETEIPIPDSSVQKALVDLFSVYEMRKSINEKLKNQIKSICPILIRGSLQDGGESCG